MAGIVVQRRKLHGKIYGKLQNNMDMENARFDKNINNKPQKCKKLRGVYKGVLDAHKKHRVYKAFLKIFPTFHIYKKRWVDLSCVCMKRSQKW